MDKQTQKELLEIVKRNYEEIADDFCETRKKKLWPELDKISGMIKNGDKIMDVGCGNGRLLEAFKEKRVIYLGIDQSQALLNNAREKYQNQKFAQGNILELGQIPDYNFDFVFCVAVLHHIPSHNLRVDALKQLKNKIINTGRIVLVVWNFWTQKKLRKLIVRFSLLKMIKKNKMEFGDVLFDWKNSQGERVSQRYYHAFTKRELKKTCKKAGLKIEKIYKDEFNYYAILRK